MIAVVIPLYNGAADIGAALASVANQTMEPHEIIVVDDGSTDGGPEIVKASGLPVTLLRKTNGGVASARNLGIRHSRAELIAFLDQDDIWHPQHLEELARPFASDPALGLCYSDLSNVSETGEILSARAHEPAAHPKLSIVDCLKADMMILPSAAVISRRAFEAVGGFDERLAGYEDDDLFLRILAHGFRCHYVDKPLAQWRHRAGSGSRSPRFARSRMIYARKLLASFPEHRGVIAARFMGPFRRDLFALVRAGDREGARRCLDDIREFSAHLRFVDRVLCGARVGLRYGRARLMRARGA